MSITYLKNTELKTVKKGWEGNPIENDCFQNLYRQVGPAPFKQILKWKLSKNPQKEEKRSDNWKLESTKPTLDVGDDYLVWLGHASFLVQMGGKRLLIDPVLFDLPFIPRLAPCPISIDELPKIDYLFISHDHRDHLDLRSLKSIFQYQSPKVLTPLKVGGFITKKLGYGNVEEAGWYQEFRTEGVKLTFLPSFHWGRRVLNDTNNRLWGSLMIQSNDRIIYFGGDSAYEKHFKELGNDYKNIDYAILGIGAYSPSYIMKNNHMSPKEAYMAFQDLGAKVMLPMHYGTYDLSDEPIGEPEKWIKDLFNKENSKLRVLKVGELLKL